ncbi:ras guanine nucleotide exchange factor domain-containing protein [Copromyces sp. CBS 386.78]|nr:ras guanine nucleotide exchange factor domain-containing protein [Copromyces sp. CBS 386.78]
MASQSSRPMRSSLQVAPLAIQKTDSTNEPYNNNGSDAGSTLASSRSAQSEMTSLTENFIDNDVNNAPPIFHNFLQARYPFQPEYAMADSAVTMPLTEKDIVLVHSVHTNGWADGTLLKDGTRGWLPTNYCVPYNPEEMRILLGALVNFWDLMRCACIDDREMFGDKKFMKGLAGGVIYLLDNTGCLHKDSSILQRHTELKRSRKSIHDELKALAHTASKLDKKLKSSHRLIRATEQQVNEMVDDMILRAFRIVLKAAEFFDMIQNDKSLRLTSAMIMETVMEEEDSDPVVVARSSDAIDARSRADSNGSAAGPTPSETSKAPTNGRLSPAYQPSTNANRLSHGNSLEIANRLSSATICHRVSLAGPSPLSQAHNLASERLTKSRDILISDLACMLGRLQLEFLSRPDLALGVKQAITSGGDLLLVMDVVSARNSLSIETLAPLRAVMYDHIQDLYQTARDVLVDNTEDAIVPQAGRRLHVAAVGCVKLSGTCHDKTKWVIGQIGDFEFEFENGGLDLGFDLSAFDAVLDVKDTHATDSVSIADSNMSEALTMSTTVTAASTPAPRPTNLELNKPLPDVPLVSTPVVETSQEAIKDSASAENISSVSSLRASLPPLPKLSTEIPPAQDYSPTEGSATQDGEFRSFRAESMTASSSASATTYISRTSESSMVSQTSTRATTPDLTHAPRNHHPSVSELSLSDSATLSDESDDAESRLLEKTYAHELIFNKEGQVTGGSLPALVERLTTHESTPDAMFVSTFYLTFRLFCTPIKLAEALIDRFNYVGEAPHVAAPVRLRTYNVFKGWMESNWREDTDTEALPVIKNFAESRLSEVLPSAGKRLLDLAEKVANSGGTLVPRLVCAIAKTSSSGSQFIPAETPLPSPNLSRGQVQALANWKAGGVSPSIMDFDALEIARQITIKQIGLFCSITPEELLGSKWTKNKGVGAPNVKAMSTFTTGLSNLVVDSILRFDELKKRATVIKHWIKIGSQFLALNNYDGLMAVTCALTDSSIKRLRMTWDTISSRRKETLKSLQAIVEISQNYKALRARLADQVPPCLPYVGMFLTDLTFVDAGNPSKKTTDMGLTVINFDKHTKTAKCIGELQRFQIPYRLTEVPDFQEWILSQIEKAREIEKTDKTPAQLLHYRQSLLLEPKEVQQNLRTQMEAAPSSSNMFSWIRNNHSTQGLPTSAQV